MRVLVLFATVLVCTAAAPSGSLVPLSPVLYPAVAFPTPTISPGDIQAAQIDAQIQAEDLVRAAADRARELNEQVSQDFQDKALSATDLANEQTGEQFWSNEERKWQALDALKTAEAQFDGSVASNVATLPKSAVLSPVIASPVSPLIYSTPGLVQSSSIIATQSLVQSHPETIKAAVGDESAVKSAETKSAESKNAEIESAGVMATAVETKSAEAKAAEVMNAEAMGAKSAEAVGVEIKSAEAINAEPKKVETEQKPAEEQKLQLGEQSVKLFTFPIAPNLAPQPIIYSNGYVPIVASQRIIPFPGVVTSPYITRF